MGFVVRMWAGSSRLGLAGMSIISIISIISIGQREVKGKSDESASRTFTCDIKSVVAAKEG